MNAHEVIESYVTEVVLQLPRRQRNDVACELRALLVEELQGRAADVGRAADAAMAIELVKGFGRPGEVAARYRPTLTIIDPADGRAFLRATVIGLALIWALGLVSAFSPTAGSGWSVLSALGRWWGGAVLPSLWWPGVLVVGYGLAAWSRRRWPQTAEWKPRPKPQAHTSRAALVLGIVGIVCGVYLLINPRWLLDVFWGGRAAPAAYHALTYSATFAHRQAAWLLALVVLNVPLLMAVVVKGRWTAGLRRLADGLALATCAALLWTLLDGPIMIAPASDHAARFFIALVVVFTLISMGIRWYRQVRPKPDL